MNSGITGNWVESCSRNPRPVALQRSSLHDPKGTIKHGGNIPTLSGHYMALTVYHPDSAKADLVYCPLVVNLDD